MGLFIGLVKASDTVLRKALFAILRRFGFPEHFVNIVIYLHENALIIVKIGEDDSEVESFIGVRQGSCEGPILFLFIMKAAMDTFTWPVAKPVFRTHLRRFGLMMLIGADTTLFKTEAVYFPPPCVGHSNADTSRFDIRN